jgi:hypothetical protein
MLFFFGKIRFLGNLVFFLEKKVLENAWWSKKKGVCILEENLRKKALWRATIIFEKGTVEFEDFFWFFIL